MCCIDCHDIFSVSDFLESLIPQLSYTRTVVLISIIICRLATNPSFLLHVFLSILLFLFPSSCLLCVFQLFLKFHLFSALCFSISLASRYFIFIIPCVLIQNHKTFDFQKNIHISLFLYQIVSCKV
jgi:branched-subunit amino acid permease